MNYLLIKKVLRAQLGGQVGMLAPRLAFHRYSVENKLDFGESVLIVINKPNGLFIARSIMASKGELTRTKIVDKATQVFHRKGFLSTTINDLLAATGTTKGNLYFHFSSKEEVAAEVLRQAHEQFRTFLATSLQGPTPGAKLDNFFCQALARNRSKGFVGGCLFGNTALEASDNAPQLAALVAEVFAEWIRTLQETIAAAQNSGEVRDDLAAADLAGFVVSALEGAIMLSRLNKEEKPLATVLDSLRSMLELTIAESPAPAKDALPAHRRCGTGERNESNSSIRRWYTSCE